MVDVLTRIEWNRCRRPHTSTVLDVGTNRHRSRIAQAGDRNLRPCLARTSAPRPSTAFFSSLLAVEGRILHRPPDPTAGGDRGGVVAGIPAEDQVCDQLPGHRAATEA